MLEREHHHWYGGATSYEHGHSHKCSGYTELSTEVGHSHYHRIIIIVVKDREHGHDHEIEMMTGPGIYDEHGHHHRFIGESSSNGRPRHSHYFESVTSPPIGYYY